ncbi:hypothetical protein [Saccharothrix violaceirubra]|uniref:Uncharacterized protein n=1 Tax=Saccharothrix violaceirubra TaxID=413306 RepID=A0A7W7WWU5_9PSEU|nr:hypothetical protein [Saccharothrix violaceirubra]MBB4965958.1 hypothetical protein [Saccharothrix violaceirubra]
MNGIVRGAGAAVVVGEGAAEATVVAARRVVADVRVRGHARLVAGGRGRPGRTGRWCGRGVDDDRPPGGRGAGAVQDGRAERDHDDPIG